MEGTAERQSTSHANANTFLVRIDPSGFAGSNPYGVEQPLAFLHERN